MTSGGNAPSVDVVVTVCNAPDEVRRCVAGVLDHTRGRYRLVVIDDGSTDPGVRSVFDDLAGRRECPIVLLRNERPLGFGATANRGLARSRSDAVFLGSGTIVMDGWLDALLRCAASDPRVATVTPFSGSAEIPAFARFCADEPGSDPETLRAAIASAAVPTYPDLPTSASSCMLVRRAAVDAIGSFDPAFAGDYAGKSDFCLRAARAGWRNALADDAFVARAGVRPRDGRRDDFAGRDAALLLARHPHHDEMMTYYAARDPLRPLREAASARHAADGALRGVLHVIHHHGGGTETHVRSLIDASRDRWRHYLAIAVGDRWQLEEHRGDGATVTFEFAREPSEGWRDFVGGLCATFRIALVHLHNISACRDGLQQALAGRDIPFGYTLHDVNFACPTITFLTQHGRYCGGETRVAVCQRCLDAQPPFAGVDIAKWRERHGHLVADASFIVAPSQWAASMLQRYFDRPDVAVIAHGIPDPVIPRAPGTRLGVLLPDDSAPVVAILGAIGPDKGARRIERLVALARERRASLRFIVIGYLDVEQGPWQSDDARLTVHGRYDPRDLAELLSHYRVRIVLYPSAGPETFSYTLSETWRAGLPALVPPIGALSERVLQTGAGWVMADDEWDDDERVLDRVLALVADDAAGIRAKASARARDAIHSTSDAMADATLALYDAVETPSAAPGLPARFTNERIRDALAYRAWEPPAVTQPEGAASGVPGATTPGNRIWRRVARGALAIRFTPVGRVLYWLAPAHLIDALKARLDG